MDWLKTDHENAISELHSVGFKDRDDHPRIKISKGKPLSENERKRLVFEDSLIQSCNHSDTDLGVLLDRSGLRSMYENWEIAKVEIARRLTTFKACADNSVLELICIYFIDDGLVFSNSYLRVSKLRRQLPFTIVILRASHRNHLVNDSLPTFHYGKEG